MSHTPHSAPIRFLLHSLCLLFPALAGLYVWTGPHSPWVAASGIGILLLGISIDMVAGPERRQPTGALPDWLYNATLYAAVALQLTNVVGLAHLASQAGLLSLSTLVGAFVVGSSSGYSAIVVAHELVHRKEKHFRQLGRLLLVTVAYEHFYTEHIRGHHKRVATEDDPASARYGETFGTFYRRTIPGQFRSAWRLETRRLGDIDMPLTDRRLLRSRVVHGLLAAAALTVLIGIFSPAAAVAHVLQAAWGITLLEAVNYIEHWGLTRAERRVTTVDSWDTESWFTYYTLVGLSRHADHHAHADRPYQDLRHFDESPKMPWGYWATAIAAVVANGALQTRLDAELKRCGLGPYRVA